MATILLEDWVPWNSWYSAPLQPRKWWFHEIPDVSLIEGHKQYQGTLLLEKTFGVSRVALPLPLNAPSKTLPWDICTPKHGTESKAPCTYVELCAVHVLCLAWSSSLGLKGRLQTQVLDFCLVAQANRSELEMQHSALVKSTQWLRAQLPRPQLAPRPGTPGSVACYPSDPLIWIWRWIGPEGRESSSKDSRLLSLLVFWMEYVECLLYSNNFWENVSF